jgi:hypothetical protein
MLSGISLTLRAAGHPITARLSLTAEVAAPGQTGHNGSSLHISHDIFRATKFRRVYS